ncbi:MAG: aminopeptidase [Alphaproteobacteria bacterium]|nr:aminopeptidase [Alphaproteobacteria bacterium]
MINDNYIDFFLGGNITEPVALEIPVMDAPMGLIRKYLESYGLAIDEDGQSLDKISVTTSKDKWGYCSIITPALKPADLKPLYKTLMSLLEELKKDKNIRFSVGYPHVIDLQNLVTETRDKSGDEALITQLIEEAKQSPDTIVLDKYVDIRQVPFEQGSLFAGSVMPEPYTVVTPDYARYLRYATTNVSYAFGYTGIFQTNRMYNVYNNFLPNGQKVGFLHQYAKRPDNQLMFQNTGIENGIEAIGSTIDVETMVNRFNNPVIATYVVWQEPYGGQIYLFKIPENDPRWAKFKEYYQASFTEPHTAKRNKIENWVAEGEQHQPFVPSIDKSLTAQNLYDDVQQKLQVKHEQEQETERIRQQNQNTFKELRQQYKKLEAEISGDTQYIYRPHNNGDFAYYKQYNQNISGHIAKYKKYIADLEILKSQIQDLTKVLSDENGDLQFYINSINKLQNQIETDKIKRYDSYAKESVSLWEKQVTEMVEYPRGILENADMDFVYKKMIMKEVINKVNRKSTVPFQVNQIASAIYNLYKILSVDERTQMKPYFAYIKENATKPLLKRLVAIGKNANNEEFINLFKTGFFARAKQMLSSKKPEPIVLDLQRD